MGCKKLLYFFPTPSFYMSPILLRHSDLLRYSATVQYTALPACANMTDVAGAHQHCPMAHTFTCHLRALPPSRDTPFFPWSSLARLGVSLEYPASTPRSFPNPTATLPRGCQLLPSMASHALQRTPHRACSQTRSSSDQSKGRSSSWTVYCSWIASLKSSQVTAVKDTSLKTFSFAGSQ